MPERGRLRGTAAALLAVGLLSSLSRPAICDAGDGVVASPVTIRDFMIQNVCVDVAGTVLPGRSPLDPSLLCPKQRNLAPGERLPYHKHDHPSPDHARELPLGYQRHDSVPIATVALGIVVEQAFSFDFGPPEGRQFGVFDRGSDGGDVVATGPLDVARRDLVEQLVDDELVVVQRGQRLAARVQVAAFGERDQLLDLGLDRLRLGLAGLDPLVLDQLLARGSRAGPRDARRRGSACFASCGAASAPLSAPARLSPAEGRGRGSAGSRSLPRSTSEPKFGIAFSSARDLRTRSPTVCTPARLRQL